MDPETSTKLMQSAAIIRDWLHRCTTTHADSPCSSSVPDNQPKRLIWLDPTCSTSRLVDTPSPAPQYVALSYVWGPTESNIRTLTANVGRMRQDIPFGDLPLTLQHVFQIVRLLEIQHLWIDALCIVQDDQAEKAVEIGRMEFVYLNSTLQISAMASPGASHGLLHQRQHAGAQGDEQHHLIMKACRSLRQKFWDGQLRRDYCLLTRGWAYQERMLARRIVHFTVSELLWECKQARWCECKGIEKPSGPMTNRINNMSAAFEACARLEDPPPEHIIPMWRECVMGYSRGHLTETNDRLPAISGIGRMLGGRAGEGAYVAGIRRDALPFDLLWRCDQSSELPVTMTRRPSWSWASVDCGVDWPANEHSGTAEARTESEKSLAHVVSGTYFEDGIAGVEVLGLDMKLAGGPTDALRGAGFGQLEYAKLDLAARVVPVSIRKHPDRVQWHESHGTYWAVEGRNGRQMLPFYPDVEFIQDQPSIEASEKAMGPGTAFGDYSLVEIATMVLAKSRWEAGLVVRRPLRDTVMGNLERVGMAGVPRCCPREGLQSWFDGVDITTVTLV